MASAYDTWRGLDLATAVVPAVSDCESSLSPRASYRWLQDPTVPVSGARSPLVPFTVSFVTFGGGSTDTERLVTEPLAPTAGEGSRDWFARLRESEAAAASDSKSFATLPSAAKRYSTLIEEGKPKSWFQMSENPGIGSSQTDLATWYRYLEKISVAVASLSSVPPLRLGLNPTSISLSMSKLISDGDLIRNGYAVEHAGDNLDSLECAGTIGAFYAVDSASGKGGLTACRRTSSRAFRQLMTLHTMYRNNGYIYDSMEAGGGQPLMPVALIQIQFGSSVFLGRFDEFGFTDSEDKPFTMDYTFKFTCYAVNLHVSDVTRAS